MSHITHPLTSAGSQLRAHWILALSALFALLATTAVVLVLAIDGGTSETSAAAEQPQAALRSDGGPDESAVAASVGSAVRERPTGGPDESSVASSLAQAPAQPQAQPRPDEAGIAASISGR